MLRKNGPKTKTIVLTASALAGAALFLALTTSHAQSEAKPNLPAPVDNVDAVLLRQAANPNAMPVLRLGAFSAHEEYTTLRSVDAELGTDEANLFMKQELDRTHRIYLAMMARCDSEYPGQCRIGKPTFTPPAKKK